MFEVVVALNSTESSVVTFTFVAFGVSVVVSISMVKDELVAIVVGVLLVKPKS